jgi:hypothetical protein
VASYHLFFLTPGPGYKAYVLLDDDIQWSETVHFVFFFAGPNHMMMEVFFI